MNPDCFRMKQKDDETKGIPWLFISHLAIVANTRQLEILGTPLPLVCVQLHIHHTSKKIKI